MSICHSLNGMWQLSRNNKAGGMSLNFRSVVNVSDRRFPIICFGKIMRQMQLKIIYDDRMVDLTYITGRLLWLSTHAFVLVAVYKVFKSIWWRNHRSFKIIGDYCWLFFYLVSLDFFLLFYWNVKWCVKNLLK